MFAIETRALTRADAARRWRSLGAVMPADGRPEMDQYGELLSAPLPANRHQHTATRVGVQMEQALGGACITSLAINTRIGVRVPDMCWTLTPDRFLDDPAAAAPAICVEVASPGNAEKWLLEKAAACLDAGAIKVVVVELDDRVRFFDATGERADSADAPALHIPR